MQAFSFTNRVARLLDWRPLPFRSEWRWMSLVVMSCLALGALTAHATEHSADHSMKGAMEIQAVREGNEDSFSEDEIFTTSLSQIDDREKSRITILVSGNRNPFFAFAVPA